MHGKYFDQFLEKKKTDIDDNIHLKNYSESVSESLLACYLLIASLFSFNKELCV